MTQYLKFVGPVKWAKVWPGMIDRAYAEEDNPRSKGGNWAITMTLSPEEKARFVDLKTRNKFKVEAPDDMTFRRYEFIWVRDERKDLGAPGVTGVDEGVAIGNGSVCEVEVEAYPFNFKGKPGTAVRLRSVRVLEHVPYEKPSIEGKAPEGPPVF